MTYSEQKQMLLNHNPALASMIKRKQWTLVAKLILFEAPILAATVYLTTVTVSAIPIGVIIAALVAFFTLRAAGVFRPKFYGKIVSFEKESRLFAKDKTSRVGDFYYGNVIIYTVENEMGKCARFEVAEKCARAYTVGDVVIRLPFVEYPIDLIRDDWEICPFCGNVFPKESEYCVECGAPKLDISL